MKAVMESNKSIRDSFDRIKFNLDFKNRCKELKMLENKPLVSILIPTKNEAFYLPNLLRSIRFLNKRCDVPVEIIVVDYRSIDGTVEIAKKIGARVINVDKAGVGYASYIGVLNAEGEIIIRTDADVIITPSAVYYVLKSLAKDSYKDVATVGHIYYPIKFETNMIAYIYDKYMRKPYNTAGYFIAFRKSVSKYVNFDPKLKANDDWDFGFRAYQVLGLNKLSYDYKIAVLVSDRLIRKKGFLRYVAENLGVVSTIPVPYTQLNDMR
jgi:glycosyltransferase involved in cell wall biosynthesis